MSRISPKGMNTAWRVSLVISGAREETWIVHLVREVACAAITDAGTAESCGEGGFFLRGSRSRGNNPTLWQRPGAA
jgi:hypothetical protein